MEEADDDDDDDVVVTLYCYNHNYTSIATISASTGRQTDREIWCVCDFLFLNVFEIYSPGVKSWCADIVSHIHSHRHAMISKLYLHTFSNNQEVLPRCQTLSEQLQQIQSSRAQEWFFSSRMFILTDKVLQPVDMVNKYIYIIYIIYIIIYTDTGFDTHYLLF